MILFYLYVYKTDPGQSYSWRTEEWRKERRKDKIINETVGLTDEFEMFFSIYIPDGTNGTR